MTRLAPDWLLAQSSKDPQAPALRARSATWSRAQLLEAADGLAVAMLSEDLQEGSRVACLVADDAPAVALIHAARRIGAVLVPLSRRATDGELRHQLQTAAVDALLYDGEHAETAKTITPTVATAHRIEALLAGAPCATTAQLRAEVDLDAPATIIFTSGTTGRPKGAVLTHGNHAASAHAWAGLLRALPSHRWLACLPLFHVAGLAMVVRASRWGARLDVVPAFDASAVSKALEAGVTHLSLVPAQLEQLLLLRDGYPVPATLEAVLLGGGPIPPDSLARARNAGYPVLTTYGMTETGSGIASGGADAATRDDPLAGRPLPGVELRIEADGATDGSGEILVRGGMVFAGYVGDDAATADRLRDGWLHTGDIGSISETGLLRVLDRRDDLIISGGENVYPAEVEAVLRSHPDVIEAVVVGAPDPRWGSVPVAAIVLQPATAPSDAQLQAHCRERSAAYKVPVRFERCTELPRDALGKIRRQELRESLTAGAS